MKQTEQRRYYRRCDNYWKRKLLKRKKGELSKAITYILFYQSYSSNESCRICVKKYADTDAKTILLLLLKCFILMKLMVNGCSFRIRLWDMERTLNKSHNPSTVHLHSSSVSSPDSFMLPFECIVNFSSSTPTVWYFVQAILQYCFGLDL